MRGRHKRGSARPARPSRTAAATRKLHKRLHTHRTFESEQVGLNDKVVVSSTMKDPGWERSTVLSGDLEDDVRELKGRSAKDIVVTESITGARADPPGFGR
jgi:hypothetical protein